jgi:hypothetical protein
MKTQQSLIREVRTQLVTQCEKLGLKGYYTKEKILEIQIEQCKKILSKFLEEKSTLEYQLTMYDMGSDYSSGVRYMNGR